MIVRNALTWIALIGILCTARADTSDRWSRQITNSEWIPLTNPRNSQVQQQQQQQSAPAAAPAAVDSSPQAAGQVPAVALPPALQQQYQDQLLQLQKTQESIQRLLQLQQQLKAQQQILQTQAYQPNGFGSSEEEKQALHQSTIVNLQTLPQLAPEVLVPPVPSGEALPPVFQPQDFLATEADLKRTRGGHHGSQQDYRPDSITRPTSRPRDDPKDYRTRQKTRFESAHKHKEEPSHVNFVTPPTKSQDDEEIQLVYVPAETLAQRGKLHRTQNRKLPNKHHQHHSEISSTSLAPHDAYAREILHQLQRQHEEKNQFLSAERDKEIQRLQAEQVELEKQARLHQETVRKEQELMREREAEKKRKELEKIEEASRQRELQRIRDIRERERQEDRRLAELKVKQGEERRKELQRFSTYQKDQVNEEVANQQLGVQSQNYEVEQPHAQALVQNSPFHQHLTEVTSKNVKNSKPRNKPQSKLNQYQADQQDYREPTETQTLPPPNQPPLSVFMGDSFSDHHHIQLTDVLKTLKSARTIAVLDNFGPETPRVFVGPRHLEPPPGYAKFELPYLSSIENNRVERKVDKLPFFVAPLSFEPPPGYSKIPFPAPHIGSVVINTLENVEVKQHVNQSPNLNPLIEPNAYQVVSNSPLPVYDVSTPASYTPESITPRYELSSSLPPSQSTTKWRFQEFYENKPSTESPQTVTAATYQDERTATSKLERPTKIRNYYSQNEVSTTPNYYSPKTVSAFSYESVPQSTPVYSEAHSVDTHFIDQNGNHHRPRFPDPVPTSQRYPVDPTGHAVTNTYFLNQSPNYEEQTQYNLPAELPAISPQLPGLVNALVEKTGLSSTAQTPTTAPTTTTTTTTTTETPTTTYRPRTRLRGRVSSSRTTTLSPPTRTTADRTRRPVNRSRSKYTTTTEDYRDSSYDPTRRSPVTTARYDDDDTRSLRRPTVRNHNYRPREEETKESIQSQVVDSNGPSQQGQQQQQQLAAHEGVSHIDADSSTASAAAATAPLDSQRISDSILPLAGLEYPRKSNLASNDEQLSPINGFDYSTREVLPSPAYNRDFGSYHRPGKTESLIFQPIAGADGPNVQRSHLQDFSPVYHPVPAQGHFDKADTPRPVYNNDEEQPGFLPIPQDKPDDYAYITVANLFPETPTTTTASTTTTTTSTTTTTEAPVIIRQRVRGRLSGRPSQQADSAIQTRPRGSHDEYVRFSAVNQDSTNKPATSRPRSRQRTRTQQHQQNSPIQTNGGEFVRFQAAARRLTTTTSPSATTRPTEERPSADEEDDYGFIRTPNYNPAQQSETTHYQNVESIEALEPSTTTESSQSQAQIIKSRQKLYSATRRPSSSRITTTPRADDVYTVRSRVRGSQSDEAAKPTKARTRSRRPGSRRRTTTTTESAVDDNNELPIDENYPRQENSRRGQSDIADENYPQEFVLNYGASQALRRDEYEPSQTTNEAPRRQQYSSRRPSGDIYGAESQWSTKLSGNSFQPSSYTPNQANDNSNKFVEAEAGDKAGDLPEIITAGPDVPSITVLVSSDDNNDDSSTEQQQPSSSEESAGKMMQTMIDFGKKMNADEEADNVTATPAGPTQSSTENSPAQELNKPSSATFKKAGLRRRRVRVRVRPAGASSEDFVTAESQSYDSSLNNLPREPPKFRNFYLTTVPTTTASATTTTTTTTEAPQTEKSAFEAFLDKMLGDNEDRLTTLEPEVVSTTSNPDDSWMLMSTIAPSDVIRDDTTTVKESREESATTLRHAEEDNTEVPTATSWPATSASTAATTTTTTPKFEESKSNSGENAIQSLNQENSLRYFVTKSPAFNEYLRSQEQAKAAEGSADYPKNHRSKWSEVRYPSDKSLFGKWLPKNQTEEKQRQQQAEGDDSSVTDYVKAIFESIKSADEEHHQDAKLAEHVSTSTANSRQDKELFKAESTSSIPTEVKTSVSSSSRVVFRPLASNDNPTTSTTESATFGPFVPSMMSDKQIGPVKKSSFETNLGKILRTTTTTKVSHMTEICYRGRCVMSKPKKDGVSR